MQDKITKLHEQIIKNHAKVLEDHEQVMKIQNDIEKSVKTLAQSKCFASPQSKNLEKTSVPIIDLTLDSPPKLSNDESGDLQKCEFDLSVSKETSLGVSKSFQSEPLNLEHSITSLPKDTNNQVKTECDESIALFKQATAINSNVELQHVGALAKSCVQKKPKQDELYAILKSFGEVVSIIVYLYFCLVGGLVSLFPTLVTPFAIKNNGLELTFPWHCG